ncbi:SMP-30/gluconolactonase/LRE family protein [Nocardioides rubriscoriae]|uniref:SMP-30/gluconolactonase/LRE family protein n=1 Tax=Nocardioides rubriscoriae TaxID=642762 RepID=UPI0011DF66A9|nr:SMP-30/gluconolactonase/LRE family protein [Nocardioides rubriscoriae]
MLLPTPDELPYEPVPATLVKTYRTGLWFEGVAQGPDHSLVLAGISRVDHTTGDTRGIRGELIRRAADGGERTLFSPPPGTAAGVTAVAPDGGLFMAATGSAAGRGLWRVEPDGDGHLLAATPDGSWPNGVSFGPSGPGGPVYLADSALGVIWSIDPATGALDRAFTGDVLRARPGALAPGANGIQVFGDQMYVTNSDAARLVRFDVDDRGALQNPTVVLSGVPADDFAFAEDGTVYLTTHVFDTVVRADPDGRRAVIAAGPEHVAGATDCTLARGDDGNPVLYVVTDNGGLVTGDTSAAGALVALHV